MGKYRIEITTKAERDLKKHYRSGNTQIIKKIDKIFSELEINPFLGEGKPEQLKHEYSGYWSRRINLEHRIIYKVEEKLVTVTIISATGHYS